LLLFAVVWGGCARTTPIKNLVLPPVSTIQGEITRLDEGGFTLTDSSGSIYVKAKARDVAKLKLSLHDGVTVYGNLQGGSEKVFGQQIIVSTPTPHFGCVLQTSFE
jgi:hypothetical protein